MTSANAQSPTPPPQPEPEWWDRASAEQVEHYWIKTDVPAERVRPLARHLNAMYEHYTRQIGDLSTRDPEALNILIFASRNAYVQTLRSRFGVHVADKDGLFFTHPRFTGLAFHIEDLPPPRLQRLIQYQGFHQFAHSRFGDDPPRWVTEGLARMFGQSMLIDHQLIIGQATPTIIQTLRRAIETESHVPFSRIIAMDDAQWERVTADLGAQVMNAQAWSMVHFLLYGDNGRYAGAFKRYLRLLNNAVPADSAFRRAFGVESELNPFEKRWRKHAQNIEPDVFETARQRIEFLAEGLLELSQREVYPESLDALRKALREIDFKHTITIFGEQVTFDADNEALFTIPGNEQRHDQPVFRMRPSKPRLDSHQKRRLEKENPTPWLIHTKHLQPRELTIQWLRDPKTNTFTYHIR